MGEVGLCVIIRCSYTVNFLWLPRGIIWSKCERSRCADSEIIFNSASRNLSTGLKGRMSLLEHDIYLQNCSIIINDLTVSDSGLYQLSVDGVLSGNRSRHVYSARVKVIVGGTKSFHECEYLLIKKEKCIMLCTVLTLSSIMHFTRSDPEACSDGSNSGRGTEGHALLHCSWPLHWLQP